MQRSWPARAGAMLLPLAALASAGAAALRLSGRTVRWSAAPISFTPSAAAGSGLLCALAAGLGHRRSAALLGASAGALAAVVVPSTRATQQPGRTPGVRPLTIMSANCLKGRVDPEALVALVREVRPDVQAIQEQNRGFMGRLERAGLLELLPHRVLAPGGRHADAGLLSVHPLQRMDAGFPTEFVAARMTLPDGSTVPLVSVHPIPPVGRPRTRSWAANLRTLPAPDGAFLDGIVAGDFNATLDHPEFRAVLARGWRDAAAARGAGLRPTWGGYGVLRLTIDHVLVAPGVRVQGYRIDPLAGSDHRAITATLELPATV